MATNWRVEVVEKKFLSITRSNEDDRQQSFFIRIKDIFGLEKFFEAEKHYGLRIYSLFYSAHGSMIFDNPIDRNIVFNQIADVMRML